MKFDSRDTDFSAGRRALFKRAAGLATLASLPAVFSQAALAQQDGYTRLATPVPTPGDGKVEVIEFFSYGCPHCNDFEPQLEAWIKKLPPHVNFTRVPITFNREQWTQYARIYYTLEALGELERLHHKTFEAVHLKRLPIHKEEALLGWVAEQGVDRNKFAETSKSFGVQSRLQRANQIAASYKVDGVPMLAIDGRFAVSPSTAGDFANMLKVTDNLIAQSRAVAGKR